MHHGEERRKEHRLPITLHLEVSHLFRQDYNVIKDLSADLSVMNISKSGIGFESETSLPVNYYFNGKIELGEKRFFYAVLKIVRKSKDDCENYIYGAEFIGLAPFLAEKIEQYEKEILLSVEHPE
ncbi:hypothetical protein lbkm_3087 [Lachnospiraceae bacterium KM106-2]|nr:hypothetical protein lbkm_3087 [Lachnospiraceae bacterium KM106-2]